MMLALLAAARGYLRLPKAPPKQITDPREGIIKLALTIRLSEVEEVVGWSRT